MPRNYSAPRHFTDSPIANARIAKGLTQKALAEAIGVRTPQISAWELGTLSPSVDALAKIAKVLDVSMEELISVPQSKTNLKELRKAAGVTQVQLAKIIGVAQSQYSSYESGAFTIPEDKLALIAETLGVGIDDIIVPTRKNPITKYRERKGMLQSELAEKIGVSVSTMSNYEVGRSKPSPEILQRIAEALEVSVDVLGDSDE